ncbi:hypothetical protein [Limobrevibacterium gyesilva]|uniref:Uncharacterized protein n=1 Tax=Limobrevibacterium gyesilva TaxID=2991712 RepID=A0AA41YRB0_9PROT|nr:hypothetical protein [Limobrevibacterium gyesilva]MCW3477405.1 hypothetical protein [Limobrevibacterium gyesilva]
MIARGPLSFEPSRHSPQGAAVPLTVDLVSRTAESGERERPSDGDQKPSHRRESIVNRAILSRFCGDFEEINRVVRSSGGARP